MERKERNRILLSIAIFFGLIFIFWGGYKMGPGSYPRAEYYDVDIPYSEAKERLAKFIEDNPQYQVYKTNEEGEEVKKEHKDGFVSFILPDGELYVWCNYSRSDDPEQTCIGLIGISCKSKPGWGGINKERLSRADNKLAKKEFETQFLDKIGRWSHYEPIIFRWLTSFFRLLGSY